MHIVDDYRPESSFFFGTSQRSLLAQGQAVLLPGRGGAAPDRAETVLRALGDDQILVGAVPFDDNARAHLVIPERHHWGPALPPRSTPMTTRLSQPHPEPSAAHYRQAVTTALEEIKSTRLRKVVMARSLQIRLSEPLHIPHVMRRLRDRDGPGFVFASALPNGRTLLGASPELLVSRDGDTVTAYPLAGSRPRHHDEEVNRARGAALMASSKDRREHAMVVDDVIAALSPLCRDVAAAKTPHIVRTGKMIHLGTRVSATVDTDGPSALSLAAALHPTPAVCGTPTQAARRTIGRLEGFDRDFYTGMVGWCDTHGNGEWAVTIRCAQANESAVRLYAGAGIVEGSDPESELDETSAKLRTMLHALGEPEEVTDGQLLHALA